MIWADILKIGAEIHKAGKRVEVTESFANSMLRNFNRLVKEGAEVPVLKEHQRDGYVFGQVEGMRLRDGYLQAGLSFIRPQDREAYNMGMLRGFSPGFALNFDHPHSGELMGPTVVEVSFTATPYQHNLRPPQETNPGVRLDLSFTGEILTPEGEETMEKKTEAAETVEATEPAEASVPEFDLREAFNALRGELVAEMRAMLAPEPAAELSDADRIIEELSAKVQQLEDDKTRMELAAAGITENVGDFVELKRTNPNLFAFTVGRARSGNSVQAPIGQPGAGVVSASRTPEEILELAAKDGITYAGGQMTIWLARNHPDQLDEVLALARK